MVGRRIAVSLIGAGLLAAGPALAEEGDGSDIPAYARTASTIATAIYEGEDLSQREDVFALHPAEYAELARLAGCDGNIRPTAMERAVQIDWACGEDSAETGLSRSTVMMFAKDGRLVRFGINAPLEGLAPTAESLEESERTFPQRTASRLADAIMAGGDASLNGLVPLTALDRERLAGFAGSRAWISNSRLRPTVPGVAEVKRIRLGDGIRARMREVYLYFDAEDRPLGLAFAPAQDPDWKPEGFAAHRDPIPTFGAVLVEPGNERAARSVASIQYPGTD